MWKEKRIAANTSASSLIWDFEMDSFTGACGSENNIDSVLGVPLGIYDEMTCWEH